MPASKKNAAGAHPGVTVQMPDTQLPSYAARVPSSGRRTGGKAAAESTRIAPFLVVLLALILVYVLFTVGTMVPQARAHFLHLIMNPAPAHFLKAG